MLLFIPEDDDDDIGDMKGDDATGLKATWQLPKEKRAVSVAGDPLFPSGAVSRTRHPTTTLTLPKENER